MPELAECEFYRRRWEVGLRQRTASLHLHAPAKVFRGVRLTNSLARLQGTVLRDSHRHGKQLLFQFSRDYWLGIHLGMSGELRVEPPTYRPKRHDHLVIFQRKQALVFTDPRQFGRIRFDSSARLPGWFRALPPEVLSPDFTVERVYRFLQRRRGSPIKSILLMQECFVGIGNWMADEILFRARLHPLTPGRDFTIASATLLQKTVRQVAREALRQIAGVGRTLPAQLNERVPDHWLFNHRWKDGGNCPISGQPLLRQTIGGRTTCWSPAIQAKSTPPFQKLPPAPTARLDGR